MKRYRSFYEKHTRIKVPKGFDVHHIDQDRENNDITNLVAIPKKLHRSYHSFNIPEVKIRLVPSIDMGISGLRYGFPEQYLSIMIDNSKEISQWILYREYLLGNFPLLNGQYTY